MRDGLTVARELCRAVLPILALLTYVVCVAQWDGEPARGLGSVATQAGVVEAAARGAGHAHDARAPGAPTA